MKNEMKKAMAAFCAALGLFAGVTAVIAKDAKRQYKYRDYENRLGQIVTEDSSEVKVTNLTQTFEPGTHVIVDTLYSVQDENVSNVVPKGYELYDYRVEAIPGYYAKFMHTFVYVNTTEVVANGEYDASTNQVVYNTPGTPVDQKALILK